ncbi:Prefoldin subunit 1 [Geodia barretti]|uniref:Prefoldin subunit 1 n=1 Tax=Geodia barretti TaxID=519541 RepID=A0AA35XEY9_GEOBA|nr:Prefoldin subunit 1 [Geodia barretti]
MADEELKKAFSELQVKRMETTQLVAVSEGQRQALQRSITHSQLTCKEITEFPEGTPLYQSVGRMFLLATKEEVKKSLSGNEASAREKIGEIEKNISRWEKALKEQEDSLRELVSHKQSEK